MSDNAIIAAIGEFVKQNRLGQNRTQAKIAEDAGINRWTLSQLENGEAVTMTSLIQILRALDLLHIFDVFKFSSEINPIELAKLEKKKRKRARGKTGKDEFGVDW